MSGAPLILAAALGAAMSGSGTSGQPITLVTEATPSGVVVQVVGRSAEPVAARYMLEVSSGPTGGNRSVQSGTARLKPGEPVVLLTARLGGVAGRDWTARLRVEPDGREPYEMSRAAR